MTREVTLRRFTAEDWPWLRAWYADPQLNAQLGPLDEDWLHHVLAEHDGVELVASHREAPVAVVGCVWGTGEHPDHVITDLAVAPGRRREGWAAAAVQEFLAWPGHLDAPAWRAYVESGNQVAFAFFESLGWALTETAEERGDDLHLFRRRSFG
ncbi:GNAT family N-acetyltransferase [Aeromicrobium phragmitis]|uniref:GNAT family N-acetyltransferase n=1 Tax=Aeromicrobium phragmitis TaxID=2478914 RepID=A0A3L8PQ50_9ACTN|nr:GNAT family N-acetyltransferase [Aeromicrobium phragmitis]RLV56152.1 GNAT family N-acetyltransferase [Aeromicrobium phragmitis]